MVEKMAPKKTVNNSTSAPKKVGRKRVVREKTILKTPTIIKMTIPHIDNTGNATPRLTKKQLFVRRNIELANEVAKAQLEKDKPVLADMPEIQVTKGRRRQRKTSDFTNDDDAMDPGDVSLHTPQKKGRQPRNADAVKKGPTKRSADSTKKKSGKNDTKKVTKPTSNNKIKAVKEAVCNGTHNLRKKKIIAGKVSNNVKILPSLGTLLEQKLGENDIKHNTLVPTILDENLVESKSQCNTKYKAAGPIDSRKTSMTSTSSALSWTRDISTSSTTTCVTVSSNDIVCFDKKLPVLLLKDIKKEQNKKIYIRNFSSDSSSSPGSDITAPEEMPEINHFNTDLNLSTSSMSLADDNSAYNENVDKIGKALDILSSNLKNFDMEIISWIGYENETVASEVRKEVQKFEDSIFRVLNNENKVISYCKQLKSIVSNDIDNKPRDSATCSIGANKNEIDFVKPVSNIGRRKLSQDKFTLNRMFGSKENDTPPATKVPFNKIIDNIEHTQVDHDCDDDDALSLFAESITGIESSRMQSSIPSMSNVSVSNLEEYVPKPLKEVWKSPEFYTYRPTRIGDKDEQISVQNNKTRPVCEKQNADSTSIVRQFDKINENSEPPVTFDDVSKKIDGKNVSAKNLHSPTVNVKMPSLMASRFKSLNAVKSHIFRGYCFFYLISGCKNEVCHFPHLEPDINEMRNKVTKLSEFLFIQEYMLIRNWPNLRRKYGMCFVEECQKRDLSRILVEMAIDFIIKANNNSREDAALKIEVIEMTLMHLNGVDLRECEDLLKYNITRRTLLCDVFMQAIADTQNFSRFKIVFINLTRFIIDNGRIFNLDVAERILERVCILPSEEPLARAIIKILKHTDSSIFQNSMMAQFEMQLSSLKNELQGEFLLVKKQANFARPPLTSTFVLSPQRNLEIDPMTSNNLVQTNRSKRYTSPDTTNLDNLNKPVAEPVISRTIDVNRSQFSVNVPPNFNVHVPPNFNVNVPPNFSVNVPQNFSVNVPQNFSKPNLPSPSHEDENNVVNFQMHHKWNKTISGSIQNRAMVRPKSGLMIRPVMRPPMNKRHAQRQVTYGVSSTKYRRGPGQDF